MLLTDEWGSVNEEFTEKSHCSQSTLIRENSVIKKFTINEHSSGIYKLTETH